MGVWAGSVGVWVGSVGLRVGWECGFAWVWVWVGSVRYVGLCVGLGVGWECGFAWCGCLGWECGFGYVGWECGFGWVWVWVWVWVGSAGVWVGSVGLGGFGCGLECGFACCGCLGWECGFGWVWVWVGSVGLRGVGVWGLGVGLIVMRSFVVAENSKNYVGWECVGLEITKSEGGDLAVYGC
ncbi:hypothetical protein RhiirC2_821819 [Rhizophagus irregularis]|uniref:Uncharacterized protein n=1 Tax=Rhizophagus irregularis TaxID=588596 RepID=A0A2N1NJP9_9GLOM|nr:hypothetical protein RhiirC2_821819 [Rhizophagus irregularis]